MPECEETSDAGAFIAGDKRAWHHDQDLVRVRQAGPDGRAGRVGQPDLGRGGAPLATGAADLAHGGRSAARGDRCRGLAEYGEPGFRRHLPGRPDPGSTVAVRAVAGLVLPGRTVSQPLT